MTAGLVLVSHALCPYVQRVAITLHEVLADHRRLEQHGVADLEHGRLAKAAASATRQTRTEPQV